MTDQLLLFLRVGLLVLVYVTFFRVLRAVWVELRAEGRVVAATSTVAPVAPAVPATTPATGRVDGGAPTTSQLVVLAPSNRAGIVFDLHVEATIGRASGCSVVIDDPRVSKLHARLNLTGGRWVVEDLDSTNGTLLNGNRLERATNVEPGDRVQVADHVLELV